MPVDTATTPLPRLVSPGPITARGILAFLAVALVATGCRDAPTDPMVGLVAEDAYAALALGVAFPDPSGWAADQALSGAGARALETWRASWDLPVDEGRALREGTYAPLALVLAESMAPDVIEQESVVLAEAVLRARGLQAEVLPEHVVEGIHRAGSQSESARAALRAGDAVGTLEALIRGGDALREVGPEAVARALQGEVEARMGRVSDADPYSVQDLERLGRLVRGGRQAVDEGDWGLAIRRAFYAKGLLDGNG